MSLQVLIEFERYFQCFWAIITFIFIYYKRYLLIYPDGYFELEQIGIFLLIALQYFRLFCGSKGNKTESSGTMALFILLTLPCLFGNIYYIIIQTYA